MHTNEKQFLMNTGGRSFACERNPDPHPSLSSSFPSPRSFPSLHFPLPSSSSFHPSLSLPPSRQKIYTSSTRAVQKPSRVWKSVCIWKPDKTQWIMKYQTYFTLVILLVNIFVFSFSIFLFSFSVDTVFIHSTLELK